MSGDAVCDDEVFVTVPPDARHLRTLRLVAADAGERAGLDASEVDDLRTAAGELGQALMRVTDHPIEMAISVADGATVSICITARRRRGADAHLAPIAALMVDAVTDHFRLEDRGSDLAFFMTKRAGAFAS